MEYTRVIIIIIIIIITNEKIKVMLSRNRCRGTLQDYNKGEISKCQSKLWTNRNVFSWCLNETREETVRRDGGRLFHARGAATGKARSCWGNVNLGRPPEQLRNCQLIQLRQSISISHQFRIYIYSHILFCVFSFFKVCVVYVSLVRNMYICRKTVNAFMTFYLADATETSFNNINYLLTYLLNHLFTYDMLPFLAPVVPRSFAA